MDPVMASSLVSGAGSLAGGLVDNYFNQKASNKSYKFQKKVLQNQIQWRVADAVKAGIHPLAALGVNPASGPSVSVGSSSLGQALSDMGQNIGRAAEAYLTPEAKAASRAQLLSEENIGLQNDLLRAQIAGANKALLTQGATPGVASSIPVPVVGGKLPVAHPNLAQDAEAHFGEPGDWLFGGGNLAESFGNQFASDIARNTSREVGTVLDWYNRYSPAVLNELARTYDAARATWRKWYRY